MQKAKPDAIEGVDYRVVDDQWGFRHREPISDTETDAEVGRRLAEKVRDFSEIRRAITELVDKIAEYVEWQRRTSVPLHHLREDVARDTKRWRRLLKDRAGWEAFLFGSIYDAIMCPADDDEPVVPAHGNGEAEPENDQDQVRQQLRDTISAHRMTAKDFALRAGVPQPRLSVFMNGKNLRAKNLGNRRADHHLHDASGVDPTIPLRPLLKAARRSGFGAVARSQHSPMTALRRGPRPRRRGLPRSRPSASMVFR
jgi:hypothetical protein